MEFEIKSFIELRQNINLPVNIHEADKKFFKCLEWDYADPEIKVHFFSLVFLKGYSTNILLHPLKKIEPWQGFYKNYKKTFFLGRILDSIKNRAVRISLKPVYYCCINEFSDNFFHWFTEALPKMVYVKNKFKSDVIFHIPFPLKDYQSVSLKYCGLNFFVAEGDVTVFYKLKIVENLYKYPGYYHPGLMQETAQLIKNSFETLEVKKRKIYITRKSASRRKMLNESEIIEVVIRHGFEIFDFDLIDFKQQVEIIINTSILVSLHGAALTNMMFMEPGSTIVEFLPKEIINDKCYCTLAGTMKHQYYYVSCDMDGTSHITSNFQVDVAAFEDVLTNAVSSQFKSVGAR